MYSDLDCTVPRTNPVVCDASGWAGAIYGKGLYRIRVCDWTGAEEVDAPQVSKSSGYAYSSPEQYQDLYNNAKNVGYSGLDAAQKQLFDEAYPQSLYAKQGRSLAEAHQATDRAAGVGQGNFIQDANAGLTAGVKNMGRFLADQQNQSGVNPKAVGYEATPVNWGKAAINALAFLGPIGVDAAIARSLYKPLVKGLGSGLANAGIEYAREKLNGENGNPLAIGTAGLFAGLGGAAGGYLAGKAEETRLGEIAERTKLENLASKQDELISSIEKGDVLPGTKVLVSKYGNKTVDPKQIVDHVPIRRNQTAHVPIDPNQTAHVLI